MNRKYVALIATGAIFAISLSAAGCAEQKRANPRSLPSSVVTSATEATTTTTRPVETKIVTVYVERPTETTSYEIAEDEDYEEPTKAPTKKPTKKPTAKPTKKHTAKPTKKPTNKPTNKPAAKAAAKTTVVPTPAENGNKLAAVNTGSTSDKISGIYRGSWSEMTVDGTNPKNVKLTVTIHDQDDSGKTSVWKMNGSFNASTGAMVYSNCIKTNFTYDDDNNIVSKKTAYEKGQGKIVIRNGQVTWNDYQEHVADGMTFLSAKNHDHG